MTIAKKNAKNTPFFPVLHVSVPLYDVRAYIAWSRKTRGYAHVKTCGDVPQFWVFRTSENFVRFCGKFRWTNYPLNMGMGF